MKGLLARNPRKQRDIDSIADHPHINIVAADRQQTERQLNHLRSTGAVDDRIEVALTRRVPEFPADVSQGLVFDGDDVIGSVLLRDGELFGITGECDNGRTAPEELGVLNGVPAQSADTEHPHDSIRGEGASITEFLDSTISCHTSIAQWREFLEVEAPVHFDNRASRHGNEVGKSAKGSESWPAHIGADVRVADPAMPACAIAPTGGDNDMIPLLEPGRPGHEPAELVHDAGDFMTGRDGCRNVSVFAEVSI